VDPGDGTHGTGLIRRYAGKNITAATAGLAYNLGIAHGQITDAGVHNADVGNDDDAGAQNYNFNDRGDFAAGAGGLNLAKFVHYKLRAYDPVTEAN
jgi:hypothetical protein